MPSEKNLVIESFLARFKDLKQSAEKAIIQVSDPQLRIPLDENTNSLAVIMKHISGNLRSRFTDFLHSDGEKPNRDRDSEFVDDFADRTALMASWEQGWTVLFDALQHLTDEDLPRIVTIRQQPHTVADALARALSHVGYHIGQIVQLARYLAKDQWNTLTIPRGQSRQFNQKMRDSQSR